MTVIKREELLFCNGDDGRAYYVKEHVPFADFMEAVKGDLCDENDPILLEEPTHCWMRVCRDFAEEAAILVEAKPNSRGAFRVTWLQDA